jgi:hypothetical protein
MTSTTSRIDGSMGKTHAPRAPNSLSRSFCTVPEIRSAATPCFSATAWYIARRIGAVALMVKLVVTLSERDAFEDLLHVGERIDGHADAADLAGGLGRVGVVAELRRQIEGHREPRLPSPRR